MPQTIVENSKAISKQLRRPKSGCDINTGRAARNLTVRPQKETVEANTIKMIAIPEKGYGGRSG